MAFRSEPILAFDLFHKPFLREDLEALAQTIQNLLIIKPGTLPNDPLFGVGIERYVFELLNINTIEEVQDNIEEQLSRYIIHDDITVNVEVRSMKTGEKNVNSLLISIRLFEIGTNPGVNEDEEDVVELGFAYAGNSTTKKTISKIIL